MARSSKYLRKYKRTALSKKPAWTFAAPTKLILQNPWYAPGRSGGFRLLRPLRTVRASFPAHGSSPYKDPFKGTRQLNCLCLRNTHLKPLYFGIHFLPFYGLPVFAQVWSSTSYPFGYRHLLAPFKGSSDFLTIKHLPEVCSLSSG